MTISFCSKHFMSTDLTLTEYMLLLVHEEPVFNVKQICSTLKIEERQVVRLRSQLTEKGYLKKIDRGHYELTDKMYK